MKTPRVLNRRFFVGFALVVMATAYFGFNSRKVVRIHKFSSRVPRSKQEIQSLIKSSANSAMFDAGYQKFLAEGGKVRVSEFWENDGVKVCAFEFDNDLSWQLWQVHLDGFFDLQKFVSAGGQLNSYTQIG